MAAGRRISCEVAGRRVPTIEGTSMKKLTSLMMIGIVAMGLGVGISGCSDEAGTKTTQTTTGPDGSKTTVTEREQGRDVGQQSAGAGQQALTHRGVS